MHRPAASIALERFKSYHPRMKPITALAPWFGSNRTLAENVGRALAGCEWVGVPFAGGMSELLHIKARSLLVSDLHRRVLNLATVVADPVLNPRLRERLARLPHHTDVLRVSQLRCIDRESSTDDSGLGGETTPDLDWACDYFVCCWWARNGTAGTQREFEAGLSVRWEAGGGDSALRVRNATKGIAIWQQVMQRCTFVCLDVFEFLDRVKDKAVHGLYLDPPFPGPGDKYRHRFTLADHRRLAGRLLELRACRVVCRFYDHPLVRELYPEDQWTWNRFTGRKQTNEAGPEVLLIRNPRPSFAGGRR
jgi:DNA adenine methylase